LRNAQDMLRELLKIKGEDKLEIVENFFIILLLACSILLSLFIGLASVVPKGWPVVGIMLSSFFIFISIISLVLIWVIREV
jgi:glucan phosphoethanolaminetransferase (alkaline phosphatase superfamily)